MPQMLSNQLRAPRGRYSIAYCLYPKGEGPCYWVTVYITTWTSKMTPVPENRLYKSSQEHVFISMPFLILLSPSFPCFLSSSLLSRRIIRRGLVYFYRSETAEPLPACGILCVPIAAS